WKLRLSNVHRPPCANLRLRNPGLRLSAARLSRSEWSLTPPLCIASISPVGNAVRFPHATRSEPFHARSCGAAGRCRYAPHAAGQRKRCSRSSAYPARHAGAKPVPGSQFSRSIARRLAALPGLLERRTRSGTECRIHGRQLLACNCASHGTRCFEFKVLVQTRRRACDFSQSPQSGERNCFDRSCWSDAIGKPVESGRIRRFLRRGPAAPRLKSGAGRDGNPAGRVGIADGLVRPPATGRPTFERLTTTRPPAPRLSHRHTGPQESPQFARSRANLPSRLATLHPRCRTFLQRGRRWPLSPIPVCRTKRRTWFPPTPVSPTATDRPLRDRLSARRGTTRMSSDAAASPQIRGLPRLHRIRQSTEFFRPASECVAPR